MVEAVLFTVGAEPVPCFLDPENDPDLLRPALEDGAPRAYVVRDTDLDRFAALTGLDDAKRQTRGMHLPRFAAPAQGVILVRTRYNQATRLLTAVQELLDNPPDGSHHSVVYVFGARSGDAAEEERWDPGKGILHRDVFDGLHEWVRGEVISTGPALLRG